MARFYLPPSAVNGKSFSLSGTEAHHVLHVLRKKVGDEIDLFDGKDASFRGRIDHVGAQEIQGTIMEDLSVNALPIHITLFQALTRGSKWEWLLEKACEVGVARVVPILTHRTLVKLDADQAMEKTQRWNRIALAACKQSGRSQLMVVESPVALTTAFTKLGKESLSLIPWEKEAARSVRIACEDFKGMSVNVFIGPEGGWEAGEIDHALRSGVTPVRLGPTLLRTETAGLIATTLVLREFGVY